MTNPVRARRRSIRLVAAAAVVGLTSTAIVAAGGGAASAAALPQAQSVGNFLDATLGGNTLDAIAKLEYAKAKAPGSNGVQNPLDVTALDAINLPLTGALQLPQIAGIKLGAANQVAKANVNGSSYGASGAVSNSGGVSVGGDNNAQPAAATIDLTAAGLAGNSPIPLPGGGPSLAALGGVTASIGAVAAKASTPKGYGKPGKTEYGIADVNLSLGSPLLGTTVGQLLGQVTTAVDGLTGSVLGPLLSTLTGCTITAPTVNPLSLAGGAITINTTTFTIKVSLQKLLDLLGLDLNTLPANTDLLGYLLNYLTDANGLAKGLQAAVNSLLDPLQTQFNNCISKLPSPIGPLLQPLADALTQGKTTVNGLVTNLITQLTSAAGVNPLAPLSDALGNLLQIGVNVQPNGKAGSYEDPLAATAKQGTPVVDGQTVVRAIEVNLLPAAGNGGLLNLALANAAAGPSTAPAAPPTTTVPTTTVPTTDVPSTIIPTGVPAGAAGHGDGGLPVLPLVALLMLLSVAGGSYWHLRVRGAGSH